jgi:hypothetical protein
LQIAALQNLGGLGIPEGPLTAYTWIPVNPLPRLLPWLAVLLLFLLPRNRAWPAWWIWLPLVCGVMLQPGLRMILTSIPSQPLDLLGQAFAALVFGNAAFWLVSAYLGWKHRFVTFLGLFVALCGFAGLTLACSGEEVGPELWVSYILIAFGAFVISLSLNLAGWLCRHRYGWRRLTWWLMVCLTVVSVLTTTPFLVFAFIASQGSTGVGESLMGVLLLAGICFATILPFLVLSFVNSFYRERLKALLHLGSLELPPIAPAHLDEHAAAAVGNQAR